jgi:predicted ribosomally synthesized peptide with SipW-like signal peptide
LSDLTSSQRISLLHIAAVLVLVLVIGLGVYAWWSEIVTIAPTAKGIQAEISSWGRWAVAASIGLMVAHSLVPFPAEFVTFANGMLFGPVWGVAITWTGAMLGAALAFALARWFGRPFIDAMLNERHRKIVDRWARRQGIGVLLLSRLMPLISFNVINYAAGLTPISWWTFLWTTGLGILPITTLLVVTGDRVWNGSSNAWVYLVVVAVAAGLIWFLIARGRRAPDSP